MAGTTTVAFDLTFVEYERGDVVGFLCAGLSLAPVFAIVAYVSVVMARREFITIVALLGQLANTAFNLVLKYFLAQDRPRTSGLPHAGSGMPSNHSQFVFFTAAFWALHVYNDSAVQFSKDTTAWRGALYRHLTAFVLVATATGVAFSRVYLGYHYLDQAVVGSAAGLATGLGWCACCCVWWVGLVVVFCAIACFRWCGIVFASLSTAMHMLFSIARIGQACARLHTHVPSPAVSACTVPVSASPTRWLNGNHASLDRSATFRGNLLLPPQLDIL